MNITPSELICVDTGRGGGWGLKLEKKTEKGARGVPITLGVNFGSWTQKWWPLAMLKGCPLVRGKCIERTVCAC